MFTKIKKENIEQNKENLTNYLIKDYYYDKVNATSLIERPVEEEAVKIVSFNWKELHRIIAKDDTTILASATQPTELGSSDLEMKLAQVINKAVVKNPTPNTEAIEKLFNAFVKIIENRLLTFEDWFIGSNLDVKTVKNSREEKGICIKNLKIGFRN